MLVVPEEDCRLEEVVEKKRENERERDREREREVTKEWG